MKRRTFITLAGVAATGWFPRIARAISNFDLDGLGVPVKPTGQLLGKADVPTPTIKVIGIGGAGTRAVEHMIADKMAVPTPDAAVEDHELYAWWRKGREWTHGVEFVCIDSDAESLRRKSARTKLLLDPGIEYSWIPEGILETAIAKRDSIAEVLQGAHTVIIVSGMGGDTGTIVSPVVAGVAKGLGIRTLAMAIKPFEFEGHRMGVAEKGIEKLSQEATTCVVFHSQSHMNRFMSHPSIRRDISLWPCILGLDQTDRDDRYPHESFGSLLALADMSLNRFVGKYVSTVKETGTVNLNLEYETPCGKWPDQYELVSPHTADMVATTSG